MGKPKNNRDEGSSNKDKDKKKSDKEKKVETPTEGGGTTSKLTVYKGDANDGAKGAADKLDDTPAVTTPTQSEMVPASKLQSVFDVSTMDLGDKGESGGWAKKSPTSLMTLFMTGCDRLRTQFEGIIQSDPAMRKMNRLRSEVGDSPFERFGSAVKTAGKYIDKQPKYLLTLTTVGETCNTLGSNERAMQRHALESVLIPFRDFVKKQLPREKEKYAESLKATPSDDAPKSKREKPKGKGAPAEPLGSVKEAKATAIIESDEFKRTATKHQKLLRRVLQNQEDYFEQQTKLLKETLDELQKEMADGGASPVPTADKIKN